MGIYKAHISTRIGAQGAVHHYYPCSLGPQNNPNAISAPWGVCSSIAAKSTTITVTALIGTHLYPCHACEERNKWE